jgi:anti-anti-sigma factor
MKVQHQGAALNISEIDELAAGNSAVLKSSFLTLLNNSVKEVEIDLSNAEFIDCAGAGALAALRRDALRRDPGLRFSIRPPRPSLRRVFTLTGLGRLFPVEHRTCALASASAVEPESVSALASTVPIPAALPVGIVTNAVE